MDPVTLIAGAISSVIAAILIAMFVRSRRALSANYNLLFARRSLQKRLESAGVVNFYASRVDRMKRRDNARLIDYLSSANSSVDICAYWLAEAIENEGFAEDLARLAEAPKKLRVTIAIVDPLAPIVPSLAQYLKITTSEANRRIQTSLDRLDNARRSLSEDAQSRFEIRVYSVIPVVSVIILDAESFDGRLQLDFKAYQAPRSDSFTFELQGKGKNLYDLCAGSFLRLIRDAEPFESRKRLLESNNDEKIS